MDIVVPALGESVTEATVAKWFKNVGDRVEVDEPLVELETDKVAVEVNAQSAGVLDEIVADSGAEVGVGAVLGRIAEGAGAAKAPAAKPAAAPPPAAAKPAAAAPAPAAKPAAPAAPPSPPPAPSAAAMPLAPAVRKLVEENKLDANAIPASGKDGRLTKEDVLEFMNTSKVAAQPQVKPAAAPAKPVEARPTPPSQPPVPSAPGAREERVRMSRLRRRIAERLKEAQNTAAMLTTFNEVDMTNVMALRATYRDSFEKKHGIKLGFMSFFVRACIVGLKEIPEVNAEIQGDEIVYKNYYNVGVAVGTEQGLVVPVLRDADQMNLAQVEKTIGDLGRKARDGKLAMEDLAGGTFTISNGGIYGSLNSTPILNPPQSGILGMHKIQERPVAVGGKVEIRPMMYLALSYDHRIVDGREAVTFLVRVKECIEDPSRILLDI